MYQSTTRRIIDTAMSGDHRSKHRSSVPRVPIPKDSTLWPESSSVALSPVVVPTPASSPRAAKWTDIASSPAAKRQLRQLMLSLGWVPLTGSTDSYSKLRRGSSVPCIYGTKDTLRWVPSSFRMKETVLPLTLTQMIDVATRPADDLVFRAEGEYWQTTDMKRPVGLVGLYRSCYHTRRDQPRESD